MGGMRTADGRRRWRVWGEGEAREALAELSRSGESIVEFTRRRGISAQRIYYWKKRIAETASARPAFVAVPLASASAALIEIAVAGVTIRVREDVDAERLAEIVDVLARRVRGC